MVILMQSEEIYPYIVVYKGLFDNIQKHIDTFRESEGQDTHLWQWKKWSTFGQYVTDYPFLPNLHSTDFEIIQNYIPVSDLEQKQYDLTVETMKNVFIANKDYMSRYNLVIDTKEMSKDNTERWRWIRPNFCAYDESIDEEGLIGSAGPEARQDGLAMTYHSDFIREPIDSPGYKFVFTTLTYYNDDYTGGEIDFCIGNKLIQYKPEAGDILVFPSGHPQYFTENGKVYLHGVKAVLGNKKYLSRTYWTKYHDGDIEWFEKEKNFGTEKWTEMYKELMNEFRKKHPNRTRIDGGVRIR